MQTTNANPAHQPIAGDTNPRFWQIGEHGFVMNELLSFLRTALSTKCLPFEIHGIGVTKYASPNKFATPESCFLDSYFHTMQDFMSVILPGYGYSPLLDLFRICFQQHPWLRYCSFRNPSSSLLVVPMLEAEVFNDFVQRLRTRARQQSIWLHMKKWRGDTEHYQAASITKYVPKLLAGGDRLEPIRMDLGYKETVFNLSDAMPYGQWITAESDQWTYMHVQGDWSSDNPESRARIDSRVAMQDRERFFANIYRDADREIFRYMRGYISKMERGEGGANHFHCCFFLDVERPRHLTADVVIAAISSRWMRVTQGRGSVFNCHEESYRQKLRREGRWDLDPLDGENQHQITRLTDYLVRYFARDKDQSIHIKPTGRSRALTMGIGKASSTAKLVTARSCSRSGY